MEKAGPVLWIVVGVVIVVILRQVTRGHDSLLGVFTDPAYVPPAGGTAIPGTVPVGSPGLALAQSAPPVTAVLPPGAVTGPRVAARTGRGHF